MHCDKRLFQFPSTCTYISQSQAKASPRLEQVNSLSFMISIEHTLEMSITDIPDIIGHISMAQTCHKWRS